MFWKYVDLAVIATGLSAVALGFTSGVEVDEIRSKMSQLDSYQDFYTPAAAKHNVNVVLAGVLFLAWIKVR